MSFACAAATGLVIILSLSSMTPAGASSGEIVDQIKDSKEKIAQAEIEKRRVLGTLYTINQRMKKVVREKSRLTDEMDRADQSARSIAQLIQELEKKIAEQRAHLRARLRVMYELSGESYLAILFSQNSAHDFDQSVKFLKIIAQKDRDLIRSYRETVAEHAEQKSQLKKQVTHLLKVGQGIKAQEAVLATEQTAKGQMVAQLEHGRDEQLKKVKGLRSRALGTDAAGFHDDPVLNLSFFEQKGQMPPPVEGQLVKDFGLTFDSATKLQTSHKGWRYVTSPGTKVTAVFEGDVVYSDTLDGYGSTVIIDHGDHYYTVYAGLAHTRAKLGDRVAQGQEIAQAGDPRPLYAAGVYFEIRHFSEPENPHQWINDVERNRHATVAFKEPR